MSPPERDESLKPFHKSNLKFYEATATQAVQISSKNKTQFSRIDGSSSLLIFTRRGLVKNVFNKGTLLPRWRVVSVKTKRCQIEFVEKFIAEATAYFFVIMIIFISTPFIKINI